MCKSKEGYFCGGAASYSYHNYVEIPLIGHLLSTSSLIGQ